MDFLKSKRRLLLMAIDFGIFAAVYALTVLVMAVVDSEVFAPIRLLGYLANAGIIFFCLFCARVFAGVYSNVWRYTNTKLCLYLVAADAISGFIAVTATYFIPFANIGAWRGCALVAMVDVMTLVSRFVYQYRHRSLNSVHNRTADGKIPVAIVGAGQIGCLLAEELIFDKTSVYRPICFIDNDADKIGVNLLGLRVLSNDDTVIEKIKEYGIAEIFIAISDLSEDKIKSFYEFYSRSGCKVKLYDFPIKSEGGSSDKRVIREVRIEDLLFRDSIIVAQAATTEFYRNRVVLVTGGGGSIGSELCRQIARCAPKLLVIVDIYENNAYDIQQELKRKYADSLNLAVEIASVRDRARLDAIFAHYRPDVVFHAAAHKHVPLMEHSNAEAIKNNVFGTYNTADMAEKYGVSKFILISTDKAVNPTNVMGASKRLCEMVVQSRQDSKTVFAAVRFGNVLGSNGSVIPLFKRQIESGGPVTITDKRIIRYFMTIPEASGLVMQAGAMASCGELFVLDMGKPVKIIDLARNMIKLSGLTPYIDIDIVETGLRPGEKLYEELLIKTEKLDKTENNLIFIERDTPYSREQMEEKLNVLRAAIAENEGVIAAEGITKAMKSVVPTFFSPEEINSTATSAPEMQAAR